jgi:peroxiredoxin
LLRQGVPQVSGNEKCTTGSVSLAQCRSMPLKAQLDACRREYEADAEPRVIDAARRSIQALAETGLVSRAVTAGETAPLFRLRCGPGGSFNLADLLTRGPVVTSFLWGDWCPFCVLELQALAAAHPEIERLGATLVALSPQARAKSSPAGSGGEPPFPVMQDPGCGIAARYRIAYAVPERFRAAYVALGYPNPAKTGSKGWMLPIPATYVLDSTGLVVLSYLDADYTTRLEPTEIVVALTHLRAASIPARNNR